MVKLVQLKDIKTVKEIPGVENSKVYRTKDGGVLKLFSPFIFMLYNVSGISLEDKIRNSSKIESVPEIITPNAAVYDGEKFVGYTMDYVEGLNYNELDDRFTLSQRCNLKMYASMYHKFESIVKRGNKEGIVFPDFCTCDNIIINSDGQVHLIDYDGLQVRNYKSIGISTSLGNDAQYMNSKYQKDGLFNPNLDKKSLIILYFLDTFNINLNTVGQFNPYSGRSITLDDIFNQINLQDNDVKHKVWKCFRSDVDNDFLGTDVDRIADQYQMMIYPQSIGGVYIKRLIKK